MITNNCHINFYHLNTKLLKILGYNYLLCILFCIFTIIKKMVDQGFFIEKDIFNYENYAT